MFGLGSQEAMLIGLVALVVFGPGKLTEFARELGTTFGRVRKWMEDAREELASTDSPDEWFEDPGG